MNVLKSSFLLGTDPEFIVSYRGQVVPFLDYLEEPIKLQGFVTLHRDNVLLELNTIPADSRQEFIDIQTESINIAKKFIKKEFNLEITKRPFANFQSEDPRFWESGCTPTFNLYESGLSDVDLMTSERFCGGHIHIGYKDETEDFSLRLISNLDYTLGLHLNEAPSNRRKYYGKAGEYRRDPGIKVEYRTPSNEWLFQDIGKVYDKIALAYQDTLINRQHKFDHTLINNTCQKVAH